MPCLYKGIGMGFPEGINVWWRERCPILALLPSEAQRIEDAIGTVLRSDGVGEKDDGGDGDECDRLIMPVSSLLLPFHCNSIQPIRQHPFTRHPSIHLIAPYGPTIVERKRVCLRIEPIHPFQPPAQSTPSNHLVQSSHPEYLRDRPGSGGIEEQ